MSLKLLSTKFMTKLPTEIYGTHTYVTHSLPNLRLICSKFHIYFTSLNSAQIDHPDHTETLKATFSKLLRKILG